MNGRLIKSQALSTALEEGYHTLLGKGRFPVAVVNLFLPGDEIDVNIHPSKLEIKINDFEVIRQAIITYVRDALWQAAISKNAFLAEEYRPKVRDNTLYTFTVAGTEENKQIPPEAKAIEEIPDEKQEKNDNKQTYQNLAEIKKKLLAKEQESEQEIFIDNKREIYPSETVPKPAAENIPLKQEGLFLEMPEAAKPPKNVAVLKNPPQAEVKVKNIIGLTLLGQLNNSFILAQNKEGLFIIDQHTLHERILYERFRRMVEEREIISENLLMPVMVQLSPKEESTLLICIVQLRDLGFIIEEFGERSYLLRAVPQGIAKDADLKQLLLDLINDLGAEKSITAAVLKENVINQAACKSAVKANAHLSETEMLALLTQLDLVENAHTCPHGRPIFYKISMSELYSIFKRGTYHE